MEDFERDASLALALLTGCTLLGVVVGTVFGFAYGEVLEGLFSGFFCGFFLSILIGSAIVFVRSVKVLLERYDDD